MAMEARPGIEPGCEDLQSSTSPLRHRANRRRLLQVAEATVNSLDTLRGKLIGMATTPLGGRPGSRYRRYRTVLHDQHSYGIKPEQV
jgi:hypothetical protein